MISCYPELEHKTKIIPSFVVVSDIPNFEQLKFCGNLIETFIYSKLLIMASLLSLVNTPAKDKVVFS